MKQITEDYVSFEIAVLLKKKGFDEPVNRFYEISTGKPSLVRSEYCRNSFTTSYAAPTHQMAMKWLREMHERHICIRMRDFPTLFEIEVYDTKSGYLVYSDFEHSFYSYEEAVEAALKYVLENLI